MKKVLIFGLLFLLFSCTSRYLVTQDGAEWVRLNELQGYTKFEKMVIHWKTTQKSEFVKYDPQCECFYYKIDYDYRVKVLKQSSIESNMAKYYSRRYLYLLIWLIAALSVIFMFKSIPTKRK